jgi:hypothetical protein
MRLGALALVVGLVLDLGTGCGTSPSSTTGVIGKQNGAGGGTGSDAATVPDGGGALVPDGGAGGAPGNGISGNTGYTNFPGGEMPSCSVIATQYTQTLADAQVCDVGASNECQNLVPSSLSACPVCMTYANVSLTLDTLKADWVQQNCGASSGTCPALTCQQPTSGSCASGGTCVSN